MTTIASQTIRHKKGATFSYAGLLELPAGMWSATCQARDAITDALVQTFDVTLTPPATGETAHAIAIRAESDDTDEWVKDATLRCDIVFTDANEPPTVIPTSTFLIKVINWVTHG